MRERQPQPEHAPESKGVGSESTNIERQPSGGAGSETEQNLGRTAVSGTVEHPSD